MKTISVKEAKTIDKKASSEFGVSTLILMENAGRAIAEELLKILNGRRKKICVLCGKGNNGGDGFVAARHLVSQGIAFKIILAGKINEVKNEARLNLEILQKLGKKIFEADEENLNEIREEILKADFIIDALLGIGLSGEVKGVYKQLIEIINSAKASVLSVDVPSGCDADSGKPLGLCVKADKTVTFIAIKSGMVSPEGKKYSGEIIVKGLGVPLRNFVSQQS